MRGTNLGVFAVDASGGQLTWSAWPGQEVVVEVAGHTLAAAASAPAWLRRRGRAPLRLSALPGGPGTLRIAGLRPGAHYPLRVRCPGSAALPLDTSLSMTTLAAPPGPALSRFATISDLHVGERSFGALSTIEEQVPLPPTLDPYPVRAARAAIDEALAWGAQLLVVKGDITANSEPAEFVEVGRLLASCPVPVIVALGNHDVRHGVDGSAILTGFGITASQDVQCHDLEGMRVLTGNSPHPRRKRGQLAATQVRELAELAAEAPAAAVVLHHPPQRRPWPTHYPPGLVAPDARRLLRELHRSNARSLLLAGHTHRNRRYRLSGVLISEVGSTKDFPGGWAGYEVFEGGVTQAVYRTSRPDVLAWTESTRRALGGVWGRWSPGALSERCWSETWPRRTAR